MSNPTIELIHHHGSVRHYKQDPVPQQLVEEIVSAGQRASTSSNLQTYSVVVTRDQEKKQQLRELCGDQKHITQAPVFLTWCADFSRLERVCKLRGKQIEASYLENFLVAAVDAAIAMQNAALAAESLDLGFCYIGAIRNKPDQVISLLKLPDLVFPIAGMTLGYPEKKPRIRPRLELEAVMHQEYYNQNDSDLLLQYDQAMIETGIYRGRQVGGEDTEPELYGWLEHSARRASRPSRPKLKQLIKDAGFGLK
jgi:nitroreductase